MYFLNHRLGVREEKRGFLLFFIKDTPNLFEPSFS